MPPYRKYPCISCDNPCHKIAASVLDRRLTLMERLCLNVLVTVCCIYAIIGLFLGAYLYMQFDGVDLSSLRRHAHVKKPDRYDALRLALTTSFAAHAAAHLSSPSAASALSLRDHTGILSGVTVLVAERAESARLFWNAHHSRSLRGDGFADRGVTSEYVGVRTMRSSEIGHTGAIDVVMPSINAFRADLSAQCGCSGTPTLLRAAVFAVLECADQPAELNCSSLATPSCTVSSSIAVALRVCLRTRSAHLAAVMQTFAQVGPVKEAAHCIRAAHIVIGLSRLAVSTMETTASQLQTEVIAAFAAALDEGLRRADRCGTDAPSDDASVVFATVASTVSCILSSTKDSPCFPCRSEELLALSAAARAAAPATAVSLLGGYPSREVIGSLCGKKCEQIFNLGAQLSSPCTYHFPGSGSAELKDAQLDAVTAAFVAAYSFFSSFPLGFPHQHSQTTDVQVLDKGSDHADHVALAAALEVVVAVVIGQALPIPLVSAVAECLYVTDFHAPNTLFVLQGLLLTPASFYSGLPLQPYNHPVSGGPSPRANSVSACGAPVPLEHHSGVIAITLAVQEVSAPSLFLYSTTDCSGSPLVELQQWKQGSVGACGGFMLLSRIHVSVMLVLYYFHSTVFASLSKLRCIRCRNRDTNKGLSGIAYWLYEEHDYGEPWPSSPG